MTITTFPINTVLPTANIIANTPSGVVTAIDVQGAINQLAALVPPFSSLKINASTDPLIEAVTSRMIVAFDQAIEWGYTLFGYGTGAGESGIAMGYTNNASPTGHGLPANNKTCGAIFAYGDDGVSTVQQVGRIAFKVDGTASSSSMPGKCVISVTPAGSLFWADRMLIDSNGMITYTPGSTTPVTLATNGQFTLTPTSNTNFRISYRGSDGTTRVGNITLA